MLSLVYQTIYNWWVGDVPARMLVWAGYWQVNFLTVGTFSGSGVHGLQLADCFCPVTMFLRMVIKKSLIDPSWDPHLAPQFLAFLPFTQKQLRLKMQDVLDLTHMDAVLVLLLNHSIHGRPRSSLDQHAFFSTMSASQGAARRKQARIDHFKSVAKMAIKRILGSRVCVFFWCVRWQV